MVAGMAWWCENAFPSLMQPTIQTSTAFTVNNRLTLNKMHHIGIGKELSFLNSWTTQGCRSRGGLAEQLTLSQPGGQIMPTTVLRAPPRIFRPCDGPDR